jgi:hypothetical protein
MLRSRTAGWIVSPVLGAGAFLAVVAAIIVVAIGKNEQHHRAIPHVSAATVTLERPGQQTAHGVLTRGQANDLAGLINRLGQAPSDGGCGLVGGYVDVISFAASSGPISVEVTSCSGVSISSHGEDWGANKYDWNGVVTPALRRDLPNLPWAQLNGASP